MIYIAFPDIPMNAVKIVTDQAWSDFNPHWNLFRGQRYHHAQISAATASDRNITFTMADGAPRSASYCILARADLLLAQGMTGHTLYRSTDGVSWTTAFGSTLSTSNLIGNRSQDIIQTFTQTSSYQYWRSTINCPSAVTRYSKLYFGNLFDFGYYPDDARFEVIKPLRQDFMADSGAAHQIETGLPRYRFNISWDGISDAKVTEFKNLLRPNYQGFFLYAPTAPELLAGNSLMHVRLTDFQKDDQQGFPDWNKITCQFEELIG